MAQLFRDNARFIDCNSAVKHVMSESKLEAKVVCNSSVYSVLENLPLPKNLKELGQKVLLRNGFNATNVVRDVCKCSCTKMIDDGGKR